MRMISNMSAIYDEIIEKYELKEQTATKIAATGKGQESFDFSSDIKGINFDMHIIRKLYRNKGTTPKAVDGIFRSSNDKRLIMCEFKYTPTHNIDVSDITEKFFNSCNFIEDGFGSDLSFKNVLVYSKAKEENRIMKDNSSTPMSVSLDLCRSKLEGRLDNIKVLSDMNFNDVMTRIQRRIYSLAVA